MIKTRSARNVLSFHFLPNRLGQGKHVLAVADYFFVTPGGNQFLAVELVKERLIDGPIGSEVLPTGRKHSTRNASSGTPSMMSLQSRFKGRAAIPTPRAPTHSTRHRLRPPSGLRKTPDALKRRAGERGLDVESKFWRVSKRGFHFLRNASSSS